MDLYYDYSGASAFSFRLLNQNRICISSFKIHVELKTAEIQVTSMNMHDYACLLSNIYLQNFYLK